MIAVVQKSIEMIIRSAFAASWLVIYKIETKIFSAFRTFSLNCPTCIPNLLIRNTLKMLSPELWDRPPNVPVPSRLRRGSSLRIVRIRQIMSTIEEHM